MIKAPVSLQDLRRRLCVWQVPLAQFGGLIWPTLSY
jgi:hypothetical protein